MGGFAHSGISVFLCLSLSPGQAAPVPAHVGLCSFQFHGRHYCTVSFVRLLSRSVII